jgi:hypothetical protein
MSVKFLSIYFSASDAKFKTHVIRTSVCPDIPFPVKTSDSFPTFHLESFFVTGLLLRCILFPKFFSLKQTFGILHLCPDIFHEKLLLLFCKTKALY